MAPSPQEAPPSVSGHGHTRGGKGSTPESEEIEEIANSYFQKIYTSDMTIAEVIQLLKRSSRLATQRARDLPLYDT